MRAFSIIVFLCTLSASYLAYRYAGHTIKNRKPKLPVIANHLCICLIAAFCVRFLQSKTPNDTFGIALLKSCASLPTVLLAYEGYRIERNTFDRFLLIAILIGMAADVFINMSAAAGAILFGIGHIVYMHAFIKEKRPSSQQVFLGVFISIFIAIPLFLLRSHLNSIAMYLIAWIYLSVLSFTTVFSFNMRRIVFIASLIFVLSDILLIINILIRPGFLASLFSLCVYYLSLILYGVSIWENRSFD
ncbi:MAG: hypothetical protein IJK53_06355 [Erysipelotrichaceae bacterium]|nr:hypothetical protein [Erysipelotrichaceae bacterium]